MARNFKNSRPLFATAAKLNRERFNEILRKAGKDVITDKAFESADRRRSDIGKLQQTIFFLQLPAFIYLVLLISGTDVNLNMFGITATKNLREALIEISAGLGLWSAWLNHQVDVLESILQAKNERLAKGNADTLNVLNTAYGLEKFTIPKPIDPMIGYSTLQAAAVVVFGLAIVALILLLTVTVAAVHYFTLLDIYRHPNFGPLFTFIVISFVVLADTITFSWIAIQSGILPYANRDRLMRLGKLYDTDPQKAQSIVRQMMQQHLGKGWLRRSFTRPTIPPVD